MLWVDKHRPSKLEDLTFHGDITSRLEAMASRPQTMPHLFFYGPSGSGKKTRISSLLRGLFGHGTERLKLDKRTFKTPSNKTIEINMITSNYHIEISPGDAGNNDRFVVQSVIKEIASNTNVTTSKEKAADFKVVVLSEVDRLSRPAQAALRRTMEKYSHTCRLILCCNNLSKVIEPVRSRCLGIRVGAPTHDEICDVLKVVARKESITLPDELAINIARESSRNLRRAILMMEACHVQKRDGLTANQPVPKTDWELYIAQLAKDIAAEQTPQKLLAAREKLYELLVNCIPASVILKTLVQELTKNLDDTLKPQVFEWAAFYEHRIAMGSKEIFHLEAFIAKFMAIYKKYLNELFG
ncbi:factor C subunit 3 [Seminavis robusta]|uniref:Factor C subunit 3 n=1 Tax=Seminavis robusta TaxID=568900 RepID=A0A9N8DL63_9STRA|nr:factor C subunit 3 [Seminavis robusta]|eukprot:Sro142_g066280.1 factor C subunit 3 (356) ;mRNA; r:65094-66282